MFLSLEDQGVRLYLLGMEPIHRSLTFKLSTVNYRFIPLINGLVCSQVTI